MLSADKKKKIKALREQGLGYTDIARQVTGTSETAVRRYLKSIDVKAPAKEKPESFKLGGTASDREVIRLRDELARAQKALKDAHRAALKEDAVRDMLGSLAVAPSHVPDWVVSPGMRKGGNSPEVPMTSWADWHGSEVVSRAQLNGVNEYSHAIMEARVRRLVERTISLCKNHGPGHYPGIVVNLIGDFVSGGLHPELVKSDEEGVLPTTLRVADLIVWGLTTMADHFGKVYAPAVCGNHGRKTPKPEFKNYVFENFDWLIYQMVIARLKDRKDNRIVVDVRESNEVYYKVFGQRYIAVHGDMLGVKGGDGIVGAIGPIMRGEIKLRGWADSSKMPYDMLVMGHWHQPLWLPRTIVANTLKGYCEYAKNALRAPITEPSQPLWFVHPEHGITSRWEVKVDERADAAPATEWVSVFNKAA